MYVKKRYYVVAAVALLPLSAVYVYTADGTLRQALLYFLMVAGLFFAVDFPAAVLCSHLAGLALLFATAAPHWPLTTSGLALMLAATVPVPFYFALAIRRDRESFKERHGAMVQRATSLQNSLGEWERERATLEKEIERINSLYLLGRELVEHLDMPAVIEHLSRVLNGRPGIKAVAIFGWEKNEWRALYCSHQDQREPWTRYMMEQKQLLWEKRFKTIPSPAWLPTQDAVVFWPVRLEKDLLAGLLLITGKEYVPRYLEEGEIFIPQIALGMRRMGLFGEVRERSRTDGTTELYLRRYFLERFQTEIQRSKRYASPFALLMMDIDHFKTVNDTYGHMTGDEVLASMARLISGCLRPGDLAGRYGGEEFIVLLPMAGPEEARAIAGDMSSRISSHEFKSGSSTFSVTISIGISYYPSDGMSAAELLAAADHALYWVKTHGRNAVKEYQDIKPAP